MKKLLNGLKGLFKHYREDADIPCMEPANTQQCVSNDKPSDKQRCYTCGGYGLISRGIYSISRRMEDRRGMGYIHICEDFVCPTCHGLGYVTNKTDGQQDE